jgi:DNA polymerase III alpha subunit
MSRSTLPTGGCPTSPPPTAWSEFAYLYQLCHDRLPHGYPHLYPQVLKQLAHELEVIEQAGLAGYFLIVWDIVRFAREQGIRCQGRGSAANSIVAYLLGITRIDPLRTTCSSSAFSPVIATPCPTSTSTSPPTAARR